MFCWCDGRSASSTAVAVLSVLRAADVIRSLISGIGHTWAGLVCPMQIKPDKQLSLLHTLFALWFLFLFLCFYITTPMKHIFHSPTLYTLTPQIPPMFFLFLRSKRWRKIESHPAFSVSFFWSFLFLVTWNNTFPTILYSLQYIRSSCDKHSSET